MTIDALVTILVLLSACGATTERDAEPLTASVAAAPAEIRADCELAARRCTRCHTLERIVDAPATGPGYWRTNVRRMRLTPGSGIRADEEAPILRCLLYRSFGAASLEPDAVAR